MRICRTFCGPGDMDDINKLGVAMMRGGSWRDAVVLCVMKGVLSGAGKTDLACEGISRDVRVIYGSRGGVKKKVSGKGTKIMSTMGCS